jgi:hypothetical protein
MHAVESLFFSFHPTAGAHAHATSHIGQKSQPVFCINLLFTAAYFRVGPRASKFKGPCNYAGCARKENRDTCWRSTAAAAGGQRDEELEPLGVYMLMFMYEI